MNPVVPRDEVVALPPDAVVTAVTAEEPLPFLMAGMSIWSVGVSVLVIVPLGILTLAASPLLLARDFFTVR